MQNRKRFTDLKSQMWQNTQPEQLICLLRTIILKTLAWMHLKFENFYEQQFWQLGRLWIFKSKFEYFLEVFCQNENNFLKF